MTAVAGRQGLVLVRPGDPPHRLPSVRREDPKPASIAIFAAAMIGFPGPGRQVQVMKRGAIVEGDFRAPRRGKSIQIIPLDPAPIGANAQHATLTVDQPRAARSKDGEAIKPAALLGPSIVQNPAHVPGALEKGAQIGYAAYTLAIA